MANVLGEALAPVDFAFCALERLSLRRCSMSNTAVACVVKGLKGNQRLKYINLSGQEGWPG